MKRKVTSLKFLEYLQSILLRISILQCSESQEMQMFCMFVKVQFWILSATSLVKVPIRMLSATSLVTCSAVSPAIQSEYTSDILQALAKFASESCV